MFALQKKRMSPASLTGLKEKNSWKLRRYSRAKVLFSLTKNLLLMMVSGWFCLKLFFQKFNSPFELRDCYPMILPLDNPSYRTHPHAVICWIYPCTSVFPVLITSKIWLSMHPRNFGSEKIVRMYVGTSCKPGWNFAFQALARAPRR